MLRPTTTHASIESSDDLGAGERAALSLAFEIRDAIVILDDAAARAAAATLNIPTTGTLGVLLLAKERRLVMSIANVLDELEQRDSESPPLYSRACSRSLARTSSRCGATGWAQPDRG